LSVTRATTIISVFFADILLFSANWHFNLTFLPKKLSAQMRNFSFRFVYNSLACFLAILIVMFLINMNYDHGSEQFVDHKLTSTSDLSDLALEENRTGAYYDQKILNEIFLRQNVERRALLHISTRELPTANFIYAAVRKDWESTMFQKTFFKTIEPLGG
jgi:hypothetical protein